MHCVLAACGALVHIVSSLCTARAHRVITACAQHAFSAYLVSKGIDFCRLTIPYN
ncbi:hypothetical protein PF007_g6732 [Phytophthora fragariae]|uniref:Secreted protein n=1 Tax=Phytophthora fragariae TaxID=53985 RepID=A0A6A3T0R4_9STRA|nr:hypothetical protein PF007_g6732 [Phytophthora fragariae]